MFSNWNRFVLGVVVIIFALAVTLSGLIGSGSTSIDLPAAYGVAPCYVPVVPMDDLMDAVDDSGNLLDQLRRRCRDHCWMARSLALIIHRIRELIDANHRPVNGTPQKNTTAAGVRINLRLEPGIGGRRRLTTNRSGCNSCISTDSKGTR